MNIVNKLKFILINLFFATFLFGDEHESLNDKSLLENNEEITYKDLCIKKVKCKNTFLDLLVQFKPGYFYPQNNNFRKIYHGGFIAMFEIDFPASKRLHLCVDAGYFSKNGNINSLNIKTKIDIIPIGIGLKYLIPISNSDLYIKLGPNIVHIKVEQFYVNEKHKIFKNTFGATFGAGWLFDIYKRWSGSIYSEYLFNREKINNKTSFTYNGGLIIGGGLGYRF